MASGEIPGDLERAFEEAGKRAAAKSGVLKHAAVFFCASVFFAAVDLAASPGSLWFMWPAGAWGLVVLGQAAAAFHPSGKRISEKTEDA